jgi:4-aminobutyrate aminotransferase-like enzyme
VTFVSGWGAHLFTADGARWLDAGFSDALLGHGNPHVAEAVARQLRLGGNAPAAALRLRLRDLLPREFSEISLLRSSSEACEAALRLARAYRPGKDVIVLEDSDYGLTTSLANMSPAHGHKLKFWARSASRSDPASVAERARAIHASGRGLCGFFAEGVFPDGYLAAAYAAVRAAGGLNIAIERQTGLGRLGAYRWEFERQHAAPDIIVIGESLANGLPLAAVATRAELAAPFATGDPDPAACAAAMAVLDHPPAPAPALCWDGFSRRGAGLCFEIDVANPTEVLRKLHERRVLIAARGHSLLFRPPLGFSAADGGEFIDALRACVRA